VQVRTPAREHAAPVRRIANADAAIQHCGGLRRPGIDIVRRVGGILEASRRQVARYRPAARSIYGCDAIRVGRAGEPNPRAHLGVCTHLDAKPAVRLIEDTVVDRRGRPEDD